MCETIQPSHRLSVVMALVHEFLTPTVSGDGVGVRFCSPLPPSSHFSVTCPERTYEFRENPVFFPHFLWGGGPQSRRREVVKNLDYQ
jgi:hypothetical protein